MDNGKIILYDPVCVDSRGNSFRVNDAIDRCRDEAIRKANKHTAIGEGGKIERIEEVEVWL